MKYTHINSIKFDHDGLNQGKIAQYEELLRHGRAILPIKLDAKKAESSDFDFLCACERVGICYIPVHTPTYIKNIDLSSGCILRKVT